MKYSALLSDLFLLLSTNISPAVKGRLPSFRGLFPLGALTTYQVSLHKQVRIVLEPQYIILKDFCHVDLLNRNQILLKAKSAEVSRRATVSERHKTIG